ncbi:DNA repair protein rad52 [Mortierella sp. AD031]|nr:DNA repair protein rad52 [Mortierella sp. AD031]
MIKTEQGPSRPHNDNPFDMSASSPSTNHMPHVSHTGHAPVQPYRHAVKFTAAEKSRLDSELTKYLPAEFTTTRPGPGRSSLTYIEGWRIKNLANKLFGFDGWNSAITDVTVDYLETENDGKVIVGVSCIVRVTLKDGTFHEDLGYGSSENQRSKAASLEKAKKEAATDALKRALTSFGNLLGTCLYDKNYTKYLSTQRSDKAKFDPADVYRDSADPRTHQQATKSQPSQPQQQTHQSNQNNFHQLNPFQNPYHNQQQAGPSFNTGMQSNSAVTGPSNPLKPEAAKQGPVMGQKPQGGGPFNGNSAATSSTNTMGTSVASSNAGKQVANGAGVQMQPQNNMQAMIKVEDDGKKSGERFSAVSDPAATAVAMAARRRYSADDALDWTDLTDISTDDLFFGPDLDDTRPSQALPESPRMHDFENIDMDLGDMMTDDSPVKPKPATSNAAQFASNAASGINSGLPATPTRSGSFGRSTSSPSLVQTTPTKATPQAAQRFQGAQSAAPFRATTPISFTGPALTALKESLSAQKPSSASTATTNTPQTSVSAQNQGSLSSTFQNQHNGAGNNGNTSRSTTPQYQPNGSSNGSRATTPQTATSVQNQGGSNSIFPNQHNGASNPSRPSTGAAQPAGAAPKMNTANVLRANSLAASTSAANGQNGNNNNNNNAASTSVNGASNQHNNHGTGFRPSIGNSNHHQGQITGLKRPLLNQGAHDSQASEINKEPRLA